MTITLASSVNHQQQQQRLTETVCYHVALQIGRGDFDINVS